MEALPGYSYHMYTSVVSFGPRQPLHTYQSYIDLLAESVSGYLVTSGE